jgi:nitrogen fixation NifU-like protein
MDCSYSDRHIKMVLRTDQRRAIDHADGYGKNVGRCGDTVEIFLVVDQDQIEDVSFQTNGCLNTMACSNAMSDLAVGKSINDVWQLKPEDIIDYLQTLPDDHHHCAELVVGAMYRALTDLSSDKNKSWMKLYRIQR